LSVVVAAASNFVVLPSITAAAEAVQFINRAPQVGQRGMREMQFTLDLEVSMHQAGQTISSERQSLSRDQERRVTILHVTGDLVTKAEVMFTQARESVGREGQAGAPQSLAVEGKSYLVERRGEDLIVTDPNGGDVSEKEKSIVSGSMEALGRPNPLGVFLNGKKVAVGQTLRLPNEMAADLLGMKQPGGEAQKVELTLKNVTQDQERRLADFDMAIALKVDGGSTMNVTGDIALEADTCQITSATFSGPVSMHAEEGPKGHTFTIDQQGTMKIAVRANTVR
jgi:hypothetical protein